VQPRSHKRDVLVVGGGIFGLAAAWALVRSGHRVRVFDRASVPNPAGASVDQHRLIHPFHLEGCPIHRPYSDLLGGWERLWRDLDARHIVEAGALVIAPSEGAASRLVPALVAERIAYRLLHDLDLEKSYPHLRFDKRAVGVLVQSGGFIRADCAMRALAQWLIAHGAEIRHDACVDSISSEAAEVTLGDGTRLRGDLLVVAAGAWSCRLVPQWREQVRVYRQVAVYLDPPRGAAAAWRSTPAIVDFGSSAGLWAAPPWAGTALKVAASDHRRPGNPCLPSDASATPRELEEIMLNFRPYIADLSSYRPIGMRVCFYATDRSGHFRVDDLSRGQGRSWAIGACGGQGFKWAPAVALAIAAFADDRLSRADLCRWTAIADSVAA
jgi:glycine/D-amino acid oxidase-like deaminating enzyme